jgi:hypothetical protein
VAAHLSQSTAAVRGDSGGSEAARIGAVAGRGAWLLMTHDRESERDALLAALRAFRIPIDAIRREQRGSLWWVIDPPASAARP